MANNGIFRTGSDVGFLSPSLRIFRFGLSQNIQLASYPIDRGYIYCLCNTKY